VWDADSERQRTIGMIKPILRMALVLVTTCAAGAQERSSAATSESNTTDNVVVSFNGVSAADIHLFSTSSSAAPAPGAAAPAKPKFVFGDRDDYRWLLVGWRAAW
jgi:hypothetical protein